MADSAAELLPTEIRSALVDARAHVAQLTVALAGKVSVASAALRGALAAAVADFLEQHPEHRAILADRDPVAVLVVLVGFAMVALADCYLCCKLVWRFSLWVAKARCVSEGQTRSCPTQKRSEVSHFEAGVMINQQRHDMSVATCCPFLSP